MPSTLWLLSPSGLISFHWRLTLTENAIVAWVLPKDEPQSGASHGLFAIFRFCQDGFVHFPNTKSCFLFPVPDGCSAPYRRCYRDMSSWPQLRQASAVDSTKLRSPEVKKYSGYSGLQPLGEYVHSYSGDTTNGEKIVVICGRWVYCGRYNQLDMIYIYICMYMIIQT